MDSTGRDCGALHAVYAAAREDDQDHLRAAWERAQPAIEAMDADWAAAMAAAQSAGDTDAVQRQAAEVLFQDADPPRLDGPVSAVVGSLLYWFGYLASFVLFFRARSRESVTRRLRWAYRTVGVDIRDTETVDGVERTVFRCPHRNLGAGRYGQRHACHDVLDRVDDGYVTFLDRHRGLDYRRPRACAASECCYSEVAER